MGRYLVRRLIGAVVVLWLVSVMVFSLILLIPGDPTLAILGPDATPQLQRELRTELGLDQPVPLQYLHWVSRAVHGDLGRSITTTEPVVDSILPRLAPTAELSLLAMIVSVAIAFPLGVLAAVHPRSRTDFAATLLAMGGIAVPSFWLGILLILLFSLRLHWLPAAGYVGLTEDPLHNLELMILPAVTLGTGLAAIVTRMVRSSLLDVLGQDYVMAARAKGLGPSAVMLRHAIKNALIPVVTIFGLQMGRLIAGAVIVETIFSLPGVGRLAVDAIFNRDFPTLQGVVLVIVAWVVLVNLAVDLAYAQLNPRIRLG